MKSLALASLSALAAPFGVAAAEPAGERAAWRCKVETMRNVSTAENPPITDPFRVFSAESLEAQEGRLVLEEVLADEHSESFVTHSIDPATGRYEAVSMRTDHAMGEQYQIESTGSCERLASEGKGAE